ncbi:SPOR domain-containing protein [Kordiimonas sp.]|uniref:SPOR domain-containing protein n=1 Tax=Kordiimonas sp. TaxID=1970157 RepID=UPI003A932030
MTSRNTIRHLMVCTMLCSGALASAACSQSNAGVYASNPAPQSAGATSQNGGLLAIADELAAKGDHEAAIPLYRHVATTTRAPGAVTALAASLSALGNHAEAEEILEGLAARQELDSTGWYQLGKTRIALGKFDAALGALDQAGPLLPGDSKLASARGITLAALGRTKEALGAFRNTTDPAGLSNMALVFAMTDQPEAAVNILEPLAKNGSAGVQGRQNLALAYLLAGRDEDAFKMARLDLDPASVNETFTFYRSLSSLPTDKRMQALVAGAVDPSWTREEAGNLMMADSQPSRDAAKRIVTGPVIAKKVEEKPVVVAEARKAEPAPKPDVANYELKEIPPLVEPTGWALQIGAYRNVKALMRGWTILFRANADILAEIPPRRSEVDFGDREGKPKGFYYRLNAGPLKTLAQARTLCKELKARGTDCWIRPPEKSEGSLPDEKHAPESKSGVTTASLSAE